MDQDWRALTNQDWMTGERFVLMACELSGRRFTLQRAPRWMLWFIGLSSPIVRESLSMLYQFEHDYRFDSSQLERASGLIATPHRDGIAAMLGRGTKADDAP
jgi:hypothetical protein